MVKTRAQQRRSRFVGDRHALAVRRGGRSPGIEFFVDMPCQGIGLQLAGCCLLLLAAGCCDRNPTPEGQYETSLCSTLASVEGPEDFAVEEIAKEKSRLLVSSQNRRDPTQEGAIYSVSRDGKARRLPLWGRDDCSFHPHGLSLPTTSTPRLYVLNHHEARDGSADRGCFPGPIHADGEATSVEIFEVEPWGLRFVQRLADPEVLTHGNDLVADARGNVYVTVPPSGAFGMMRDMMDSDALPPTSKVVEYRCAQNTGDGPCEGRWMEARSVGRYVNGIALRRDDGEPRLVVSSSLPGGPGILGLRRANGKWFEDGKWSFGVGHDNLLRIDDETLLVASHPDLRRFLQHGRTPRVTSPSAVWQFKLEESAEPTKPILWDDGSRISGGSTAACLGEMLVWGQVFGDTVVQCPLPQVCGTHEATGDKEEP